MRLIIVMLMVVGVLALRRDENRLSVDYFLARRVKLVTYFSCESQFDNKLISQEFIKSDILTSVVSISENFKGDILRFGNTKQWGADVGILLDASCPGSDSVLYQASISRIFDAEHLWLVNSKENSSNAIENTIGYLNFSINTDFVVVYADGLNYTLKDIYNFGKIQGNGLEIVSLGTWSKSKGLNIEEGFKYYRRWNFHNLTLRAISVMDERQAGSSFSPELLVDGGFTRGIAAMTKITSQLLNLLKEEHNFRFNYSVADRWIGSPEKNSTMAVTNSLFWELQDISSTCARIYPLWLTWVDICFPPTTYIETKFYYLIRDTGVGGYENQFIQPLSCGVWWSALGTGAALAAALAAAARLEARPEPRSYAFFSIAAAICQQYFEDGIPEHYKIQGRRLTLLVVGLFSMMLYNYYTSSVVCWLLNAATPSIDGLDGLVNSDLELIFEDIGYSRGWLDGHKPGTKFTYYYSGYPNDKEDKLREKKVTNAKRTVNALQPLDAGVELMRSGAYAYHTEPYTARQAIGRTFTDDELCALAALQMMPPSSVYIMVQKKSPYKQFFVWSMMRLAERGHVRACRARFSGAMPACSGRRPRALSLGQAAPAFLLLLEMAILSTAILVAERIYFKFKSEQGLTRKKGNLFNNHAHNAQRATKRARINSRI